MALSSPAVTLAIEALFANIKPTLNLLKKLGPTDFSADAPNVSVKPGATIKVPVSSVSKAGEYNETSNNYLTGGATDWASLTASHFLQGYDISGVNVDQGVDAAKMKQLFASRAGTGIAMAIQENIKKALNDVVASTAVTLGQTPTIDEYLALGDGVGFLDKATSMLAVNGAMLADMKKKFAEKNIVGTPDELAVYCGFMGCVLVPGSAARALIVPAGSTGFIGRVPELIARYAEAGTQVDDDTGLAVGIVIADDQARNRLVANADLWFGTVVQGSPANASKAGVIKIS